MKKFYFNLQRVLDYKKVKEDEKKAAYGQAFSIYEREKNLLLHLIEELKALMKKKDEEVKITIDQLKHYGDAIHFLETKINFQREKVKNAQEEMEAALNKLVKASIEKKTFEKLKEKAWADYQQDLIKEDDKLNDQINSYRGKQKEDSDGEEK